MPNCDCGAPAVCRVTGRLTPYGDKMITNPACQACHDWVWRREVEAGIATVEVDL